MSNLSQSKNPSTPSAVAFDPWLLWVAFRRHWAWIISVGTVFATIGSLVVYSKFVPEYEATCILQANQDFVLSRDVIPSTKDLARNERLIILSPVVMGGVLSNPELRSVPSLADANTRETEVRNRVRISNGGTDDLLLISYRDTDKSQVAKVANAIASEYVVKKRLYDDHRFKGIVDSLRLPIEQLERKVKEGRDSLKSLSEKTTGIDPFKKSGESPSSVSYLQELQKNRAELDFEIDSLSDRLEYRQSRLGKDRASRFFFDREIRAYVNEDNAVRTLRDKIAYNEKAIMAIEHKEQQGMFGARYKDLKKELSSLQSQLKEAEGVASSKVETALRDESTQTQQEAIADLQAQIENLGTKREKLKADLVKERERIEKFSGETTELYFVRAQVDEDAEALSRARNRRIAMELEQGRGPSVTTRSAANEPTAPLEVMPFKKILMVGGFAFMLPFLLALLFEFHAKRITSAESIDSNQLIPILGEIAHIPNGRKWSSGHRMFDESVDTLRANLLFKMENVRTIAVTSAMSGEGKSNIAFQLASSIARCSGESVLVIDADLRNPDQHHLFGLEQGPGLCKLLSREATLDMCIDNNDGNLVHLLSAGRLDSNPHNLLRKNNFEQVLEQVSVRYRYIVVDTAPVLPASETMTIAAACDVTLVCAMRDVSQLVHVKRTFQRLQESGSNVIGTVFSGVPSRLYASRYGDYRYAKN